MSTHRFAAAQFFSGTDVTKNAARCRRWIGRAAAVGAELVVLPENSNRVRDYADREDCHVRCERLDGAFVRAVRTAAADHGLFVVVGVDLADEQPPDVRISQLLIGPDGSVLARNDKHVLWDYEYTLFRPSDDPFAVHDTGLGRLGLMLCADGIVPETPRALGLLGGQVLCNSLNSRGPDEMRVHVPLRALENGVWHVAANTVGGPADQWPWMGGSQIVAPDGRVLAKASESEEELVWADLDVTRADDKSTGLVDDLVAWRRPDLYGDLVAPIRDVPAAAMYGALADPDQPREVAVALLQVSHFHSDEWTLERVAGQIQWAGRQGATLGVLPELFAMSGEMTRRPTLAADLAGAALERVRLCAAEAGVWIVGSLPEADGGEWYHTAYLVDSSGGIAGRYRKAHLNRVERRWAKAGSELPVFDTPVGRLGVLIGDEIWLPEVARVLSLAGAEILCHPTTWGRPEAMTMAATERAEENRVHVVSTTRLDDPSGMGSQVVRANAYRGGEPIALMRYPTALWTRAGFEEQLVVRLDLEEAHSKLMGPHLDPLATRAPQLYGMFV